jgi:hypothetical protein
MSGFYAPWRFQFKQILSQITPEEFQKNSGLLGEGVCHPLQAQWWTLLPSCGDLLAEEKETFRTFEGGY